MDKTTDLLIGIVIGGTGLFAVFWIVITENIMPWIKKRREAKKQKV